MSGERAKPVVLGLVLAFIAGSYFRSDVFKRGEMASFSVQLHEQIACQGRAPDQREGCRSSLAQALIPTKLSCLPSFRDLFVCQTPTDKNSSSTGKNAQRFCQKEHQLLAECLQIHLAPYGFSNEEVLGLLFGKQHVTPQEGKPSLEVSEEGRVGDGGGKGQKPGEVGKTADKESDTEAAKVNHGGDAHREEGKPKVEVEQESDKGGDNARR